MNWMHNKKKTFHNAAKEKSLLVARVFCPCLHFLNSPPTQKKIQDKYYEYKQRLTNPVSEDSKSEALPPPIGSRRNYSQFSQMNAEKTERASPSAAENATSVEENEIVGYINEAFDQSVQDQWDGIFVTHDSEFVTAKLNVAINSHI